MQLIKEQVAHYTGSDINVWSSGYFNDILAAVVQPGNDKLRAHFMDSFFQKYHDITVYTVLRLAYVFSYQLTTINYMQLTPTKTEPTYPNRETQKHSTA